MVASSRFRLPCLPAKDTGDRIDKLLALGRITVTEHRVAKAWRWDWQEWQQAMARRGEPRPRADQSGPPCMSLGREVERYKESREVLGRRHPIIAQIVLHGRHEDDVAGEMELTPAEVLQQLRYGLGDLRRAFYEA